MPTYQITSPDGHTYQVTAPDGASQADVLSYAQSHHAANPPSAQPAQGGDQGAVEAGLHGFADAATFGLGDKIAPYLRASNPFDPASVAKARTDYENVVQPTVAAHPLAHLTGELGGAVAGGGALEHAGVAIASKLAPGAVRAAQAAMTLQKGQLVRNTARLAAQGAASGAAYGAATGAVHGSDDGVGGAAIGAGEGALLGGAGGAVLGPTGALAAKGVSTVARAFSDTSAKAIAALAKRFNMAPADLDAAYKNFTADAGHPPSLAEIADLQSRGELQKLAQRNPVIGAAAERARAKAASELPTYLSQKTAQTVGHPQDLSDLVSARDADATAAMDPIRDNLLGLSSQEADFMKGDITQHMGIKGPVRHEIAQQLDQGTLSLGNADTIRKNLSAQARAKPGEGYDQLADQFNKIVRSASPEYGHMLDRYAEHSRYIDAFQHGTTGKTMGQTSDPSLIGALQTPEGQSGYQAGLATRIHDQSFKNESSAARTADELGQTAATSANAAKTFGANTTAPLARAATAKSKALENLSVISPGTPQPTAEGNVGALHAGLAAVSGMKGMLYHGIQAATQGIKLSPAVQSKLGDMLTDPRQSQQAIAYLRAQGVKDHALRVLMTQVARATARPAGAAGAYLRGSIQ